MDRAEALEVLCLSADAGDSEIRRAYRRLSRVCHPDHQHGHVGKHAAAVAYFRIREAYLLLRGGDAGQAWTRPLPRKAAKRWALPVAAGTVLGLLFYLKCLWPLIR
jgi:preprotein translocase subunit Sec63